MLSNIIAETAQAMHRYFDPQQTNEAARRAGWIQRRSKLDGFSFLKALVIGFIEKPRASLNQLSQVCQDLGVTISAQGIDERLTEAGVLFLRERLASILASLQAKRRVVAEVLDQFSEVYLQDSTIQSLPEGLHRLFPGAGGNASSAAVKIQLLFAFLSGNLVHLTFENGCSPDGPYCAHVPYLLPGSLLIQDLGYFNLRGLQQVAERLAFFIIRWRKDVGVFLADAPTQALDMPAFLRSQTQVAASYSVTVGHTVHLPVRLISVRLPPQIAAQHRRRLKADVKRRRKALTQRTLQLCDWNIFLTNLPEERLSLYQILTCYALRWQVELIFKLWKSQAALKHLAGLRPQRILCELYAKMIGLVLTHFLIAPLRFFLTPRHLELSPPKARQILMDRAKTLAPLLGLNLSALQLELLDLANRCLRFARKNHRISCPSSLDRLIASNSMDLSNLFS